MSEIFTRKICTAWPVLIMQFYAGQAFGPSSASTDYLILKAAIKCAIVLLRAPYWAVCFCASRRLVCWNQRGWICHLHRWFHGNTNSKISKYQSLKISKSQNIKVSKDQSRNISKYQSLKISKYQKINNIKISKSQSIKVSKTQNTKVSKYQSHKISKHQSLKISKSQNIKISKSQNIKVSNMPVFGFR